MPAVRRQKQISDKIWENNLNNPVKLEYGIIKLKFVTKIHRRKNSLMKKRAIEVIQKY